MAEIHVEPRRRSMAWVWIVVVLLIIIGVIWYFISNRGSAAVSVGAMAPLHLARVLTV